VRIQAAVSKPSAILGAGVREVSERALVEKYECDASHYRGRAASVFIPSSEEEVAAVLERASREGTTVTISGGGTGLSGGRVPEDGKVLSTEKLDRVISVEWDGKSETGRAVVAAGCPLLKLEEVLKTRGLFYPPAPGEKRGFLGGNIATNASGPCSFRFGATRPHVRRLRIVLATGDAIELRRGERIEGESFEIVRPGRRPIRVVMPGYRMPACKNSAGYFAHPGMEAIDLFIGSEGTLGIATEAEIEVRKNPEAVAAGLLFFDSEKGGFRFAREARLEGAKESPEMRPRALEFLDRRSLEFLSPRYREIPQGSRSAVWFEEECTSEGREAALKRWMVFAEGSAGGSHGSLLARTREEQAHLHELRHDLPVTINEEVARRGFRKLATDFAVPDESAEVMFDFYLASLADSGVDYALFGHIGENHLHANFLPRNEEEFRCSQELYEVLARKAVALGGTISAEHGVGKAKIPYMELMYGREALREMARIKAALDPAGILNPGNVIPAELVVQARREAAGVR
jgi:D-lactate dehydrogenase (cytochrome)